MDKLICSECKGKTRAVIQDGEKEQDDWVKVCQEIVNDPLWKIAQSYIPDPWAYGTLAERLAPSNQRNKQETVIFTNFGE